MDSYVTDLLQSWLNCPSCDADFLAKLMYEAFQSICLLGQNNGQDLLVIADSVLFLSRAHMAGLLGGALAAYLLGPRIVDVYLPGNNRAVKQDRPPLGIFATQLKPDARLSS